MASPTPPPKMKLSRLRDIGWSTWDPIGLLPTGSRWDEADNQSFADEYDSYLIEAAGRLRRGASDIDVIGYLMSIEADHMGLGAQSDAHARARSLVTAIRSDAELWTYEK